MKTRTLSTIAFFFIGISISLAQENARNAPLPGNPVPLPPPPCVSPAVPSISYYTLIPGFISWYPSYGAIGYNVWVKKNGSSVIVVKVTISSPTPPNGRYTCYYTDLLPGTYNIYVSAFSSGCESGLSNALSVTTNGDPISQDIKPGNDPYAFDLGNLADYDKGGEDDGNARIAVSSNDVANAFTRKSVSADFPADATHVAGIYPNPVGGMLNVFLPFKLTAEAKFLVNDISGHTINNLPISISLEGNTQIETSGISPGIYFLTIISEHNNFKQRFIKN